MLFSRVHPLVLYLFLVTSSNALITLPPKLGPHPVGTRRLEVTDFNRQDPLAPKPQPRSLMLQLWYPISSTVSLSPSTYLPAKAAAFGDQFYSLESGTLENIITQIFQNGTAIFPLLRDSSFPALVFSPGSGTLSAVYTSFLSSLASYGYLIIGVDHPYDSEPIELPSGELILNTLTDANNTLATVIRSADVSWLRTQITVPNVLSWLSLPHEACKEVEHIKVGIFGQSIGGATAAMAMSLPNTSYIASASLDGPFYSSVLTTGFYGPFLYMAAQNSGNHPTLAAEWPLIKGWKQAFTVNGSTHDSYTDAVVLVPQVREDSGLSKAYKGLLGSINADRMTEIVVDYLKVYWDWTLLKMDESELLKRPSLKFPEVAFESL